MDGLEKVSTHRLRLRVGQLWIDCLTFNQALAEIERLVEAREGGFVFTPNVDHVVMAETNGPFRRAYEAASLSLADGQPLVFISRLLGVPLPERIAGSDLVLPLIQRAALRNWRVYLLGAAPGVADVAAAQFQTRYGVRIAGVQAPTISIVPAQDESTVIARLRAAKPDLALIALGSPKQEIWIHRIAEAIRPTVAIGVGASFDFIASRVRRCPRWIAAAGLEWVFRMTQQPRLISRYLLRDPKFVPIVVRTMMLPRAERVTNTSRLGPRE
jgi:N-acetylglucosaminyldiphosphoundecaprenol N-acetyl-beta-D-mannosaminyltransferase